MREGRGVNEGLQGLPRHTRGCYTSSGRGRSTAVKRLTLKKSGSAVGRPNPSEPFW